LASVTVEFFHAIAIAITIRFIVIFRVTAIVIAIVMVIVRVIVGPRAILAAHLVWMCCCCDGLTMWKE
jgi:hypothetical protein